MASITERVRQALGGTATPRAAELALAAVSEAIAQGLREDGEVRLANFGVFRLLNRAPRRLLLPGSQQAALLPQRKVLNFKPAPCTILPGKQVESPSPTLP